MKKALAIILTCSVMMATVACGGGNTQAPAEEAPAEETQKEDTQEVEAGEPEAAEAADAAADAADEPQMVPEDPMTYEEYAAAELDSEVIVQGGIQAKQAYNAEGDLGHTSVYLQDETGGAYFLYNLPCTEKEYELMEVGKIIKVKGFKSEWSEEVEVVDAVWQFEDGEYIAEPEDVTDLLGSDELIKKQNKLVSFKGMTIEPASEDSAEGFKYNWDGSGKDGDDLYFNVSKDGKTYQFTVESDLCGPDTAVYEAVKEFKVGNVVDLEGFLYWYEGPNPHITAVVSD